MTLRATQAAVSPATAVLLFRTEYKRPTKTHKIFALQIFPGLDYGLDDKGICVRFSTRTKDSPLLHTGQTGGGLQAAPLANGHRGLSSRR
jgi:hypothetical protein